MTARFSIALRSLPSSPHFQTASRAGRIDAMPPTPPRSAGGSRFPASRRGAAAAMRRGLETRHLRSPRRRLDQSQSSARATKFARKALQIRIRHVRSASSTTLSKAKKS